MPSKFSNFLSKNTISNNSDDSDSDNAQNNSNQPSSSHQRNSENVRKKLNQLSSKRKKATKSIEKPRTKIIAKKPPNSVNQKYRRNQENYRGPKVNGTAQINANRQQQQPENDQPSTSRKRPGDTATPQIPEKLRKENAQQEETPKKFRYRGFITNGPIRSPLDLSNKTMLDPDPSKFFSNIRDTARLIPSIELLEYECAFDINDVSESLNANGLLLFWFTEVIQVAINEARRRLKNAIEISLVLNNDHLEVPIYRPFREITSGMNDASSLLREFSKAHQSAKKGSLLDVKTTLKVLIRGNSSGTGNKKISKM